MSDGRRVLHQFPISHYCEKTRWNLDLKGLDYGIKNLLPGAHAVINRIKVGAASVPVLIDDGRAIGDSTEIALYLEERYPRAPLVPKEPGLRAAVLEKEAYFDDVLGPAVRRWAYGQALATRGAVRRLFFRGYGTAAQKAGVFLAPVLERVLVRMYRIDAAGIAVASRQIDEAVDRLERFIDGDAGRYLVGNGLTLADVTAASLLAPLVAPEGSPWASATVPPAVAERRDALRTRPAGKWVLARYAADRGPAAPGGTPA